MRRAITHACAVYVACCLAGCRAPQPVPHAAPKMDRAKAIAAPPKISRNAGDANCDGRVDFQDINALSIAIAGGRQTWSEKTGCPVEAFACCCDCNGDGLVDFKDMNPFVAILAKGKQR